MAIFGATVSAYNKKPSTAINKFQTRALTPVKPKVATPVVPDITSMAPVAPKPEAVDSTKSAVSGGSTLNASGLVDTKTPLFQPTNETPLIGRNNGEGAYKRLNAIDQTGQVLDKQMNSLIGQGQQGGGNQPGYAAGSDMFGGGEGAGLDNEQLTYARQIASIGKSRGMDDNAIQIAIMTALAESEMKNISHGDRDSVGLFQQRTSQGWGSVQQIMDPNYSINKFYDSLAKTNYGSMAPWQAAQAVQRSFDATGGNYQARYATAQRAFKSLTPNAASVGNNPNGAAGFIQSYNNKYLDFDGAYGAQCVDLFNFYNQRFVGAQRFPVQVASQLFNQYDRSKYNRLAGNQQVGRMGDVAVFQQGAGLGPAGHVAIVVGDNGNGTLRVLHSNATAARERGNSVISNISKAALMGLLRPNRLG